MKKKLLYIVINIVLIFVIIFGVELTIWNKENKFLKDNGIISQNAPNIGFHKGIKKFHFNINHFPTPENGYGVAPEGLNYKKKPIILFGCSYAYGYQLEREQTLTYKLAENAKIPVYNRAFTGWGIQHMLYQSKIEKLYEILPEPEYVMYVFMNDHIRRLYLLSFSSWNILSEEFNLRYKEKNGELIEIKNKNKLLNQIKRLYFVNKIQHALTSRMMVYIKNKTKKETINNKKRIKKYDFAIKHFAEAKQEMQKHWKNTKFAILFYDEIINDEYMKNKLKENGFIILDAKELTNENLTTKKYLTADKLHPNEKAWDILVPQITKELKL